MHTRQRLRRHSDVSLRRVMIFRRRSFPVPIWIGSDGAAGSDTLDTATPLPRHRRPSSARYAAPSQPRPVAARREPYGSSWSCAPRPIATTRETVLRRCDNHLRSAAKRSYGSTRKSCRSATVTEPNWRQGPSARSAVWMPWQAARRLLAARCRSSGHSGI